MAKEVVLSAQAREGVGKERARKLRAQGLLPAVLYGKGIEPRPLAVRRSDLVKVLHAHGAHPLVTLAVDAERHLALVKEVQVDPVHQEALHVDFLRVEADRPVHTEAPVHLVGEAAGVKAGGILEQVTRTVAIEALPRAIPEAIEFDVSQLNIGDVVRVGDLRAPEGVRILTDPEETLALVAAPRVEEVAAPAAEEAEAAAGAEAGPPEEGAEAGSEG